MTRDLVVFALMLAAAPAGAVEARHFEGQATFLIGNRFCPTQGPALKFDIGQDGSVVGGVRTQSKAVAFNGTVAADGKLTASYKASTDSDVVNVEATVTDQHIEGFTQSQSCRYKISFDKK